MKVQDQFVQGNATQSDLQLLLAEMVVNAIVQNLLGESAETLEESNQ